MQTGHPKKSPTKWNPQELAFIKAHEGKTTDFGSEPEILAEYSDLQTRKDIGDYTLCAKIPEVQQMIHYWQMGGTPSIRSGIVLNRFEVGGTKSLRILLFNESTEAAKSTWLLSERPPTYDIINVPINDNFIEYAQGFYCSVYKNLSSPAGCIHIVDCIIILNSLLFRLF